MGKDNPSIGIIGGGVIGLSTAVCLQQEFPRLLVKIYGDQEIQDTTSAVAAGIFRPSIDKTVACDVETMIRWCRGTWRRFCDIAQSSEGAVSGVFEVTGYIASRTPFAEPKIMDYCSFQNRLLEDRRERAILPFAQDFPFVNCAFWRVVRKNPYEIGYFYSVTTMCSDPARHMPWLREQFLKNGGIFEKTHVESVKLLAGKHELTVNCSGIGARYLGGVLDQSVYPVRGQVIKVRAPWIKHFAYIEGVCYWYPGYDQVTLGGIRQKGDWDTSVRNSEAQQIWQNCTTVQPSFNKAQVLKHCAGLRPSRDPVRVEAELMEADTGQQLVVHNYGHGANGWALSWGTAEHAVVLAKHLLSGYRNQKSGVTCDFSALFSSL